MISPAPDQPVRLSGKPVDLQGDVTVTAPRWMWVNLLSRLYLDYDPDGPGWAEQLTVAVARAADS